MQATNERHERPLEESPLRRAKPGQDAVASLDPRRTQPPGEAPRRKRSGGASGWKQVHSASKVFLLSGLLIFTLWRATHSTALAEARRAYDRHYLTPALRWALDHLDRRPFSHDAAVLAARCLSDLDYGTAAEAYYQRASWTGTLSLDDLHHRAYGLVRANARLESIKVYEEILRVRPDDALALRRLATVYYSMKAYVPSKALAEKLTRLPDAAEVGICLLGTIHHEVHHLKQAVDAYEQVLTLDPTLSRMPLPATLFWSEYTEDLITLGRAAEARRLLLSALASRDEPMLHFLLARAERARGDFEAAEACCNRAVEKDPTLREAWVLLGQLALPKREPRKAVACLNRALALSPDDFETNYGLSIAYRLIGDVAAADRFARKVERLRSTESPPGTGTGLPHGGGDGR